MFAGLKKVTSKTKPSLQGTEGEKMTNNLLRSGYSLVVTSGQRKYGGPPPGWEGSRPGNGCEVYCGKIPNTIYEEELIPHLERCGQIWELRLMMDPVTGLNKGYAFITFTKREEALEAVRQLNSLEIVAGHPPLKVNISVPNNTRLFVGNIPKSMTRTDIIREFDPHAAGLTDCIVYSSPDSRDNNRGFCFLEYESHIAASRAKSRFDSGQIQVWSCDIFVDWADPQEEPDEDTMSRVKILYCRNLTSAVTEADLRALFGSYGNVERVKKIKYYAFIHFEERDEALSAMSALNNQEFFGAKLEISLSKPPSDKNKKEEMLRNREKRMIQTMTESLERRGTGDGLLFHGRGDRGVPYQERGDGGLPNLGRGAGGSFVWGFSRVKGGRGQQY